MRRLLCFALGFCLVTGQASAVVPSQEEPIAVLRALDKMTARVEELNVTTGQPFQFGTLIITLRTCRVTPAEEMPEAAAFLEISEFKPGERDIPVFRGWMFASSPALSAMSHPIYDIWVTGCKPGAFQEPPPAPGAPAVPSGPVTSGPATSGPAMSGPAMSGPAT
nr:DUF2155 domain-containing protein [Pseudomonadota bacterium]